MRCARLVWGYARGSPGEHIRFAEGHFSAFRNEAFIGRLARLSILKVWGEVSAYGSGRLSGFDHNRCAANSPQKLRNTDWNQH